MVFFNHATRQMTAKIVYYGPGLCGKTTNLNTIYGKTSQKARGEMVSLNTETDRTLFFDLLPMDVGVIGGFKAKLQLYTVPGQVFYNSTRKLVLKGVDGIVFVADSQVPMFDANKESLQNLEANLKELGLDLRDIPMVFQWNKRDLKNVVPAEELERGLNIHGVPSFLGIAADGTGVFETLRGITKMALALIKQHHFSETDSGRTPAPAPVSAPVPPPAPVAMAAPVAARAEERIEAPEALSDMDLSVDTAQLDADLDAELGTKQDMGSDDGSSEQADPAPLTASELLTGMDSVMDLTPPPMTSIPTLVPAPIPAPPQVAPIHAPSVSAHSVPALALPKPAAPALPRAPQMPKPQLSPMVVPLQAPRPKAAASPKTAAAALLGDLNFSGAAVLKVALPEELDSSDLEIVVQVRQKDHVVAEGHLRKPAPGKGGMSKLTVEFKRG